MKPLSKIKKHFSSRLPFVLVVVFLLPSRRLCGSASCQVGGVAWLPPNVKNSFISSR